MYRNTVWSLLIIFPFFLAGCENDRYSQESTSSEQEKEGISWYMTQNYQCGDVGFIFHHGKGGVKGIQVGNEEVDVGEESVDIKETPNAMVTEGERWTFRSEANNVGKLINRSNQATYNCRLVKKPTRSVRVREKFPTMRQCLNSITSRTGSKIRSTYTDTPSRVIGTLVSGTEFSCIMEATGTEGVYFESSYRVREFL